MKLMKTRIAAALSGIVFAGVSMASAQAAESAEYAISLAKANTITEAALKCARAQNLKPMAIAVLDSGGHLISFAREDAATFLRYNIATGKAWGALALHMDSAAYVDMAEKRPAFFATLSEMSGGRMIPSPGGVVVRNAEGRVIGAVGMTGDAGEKDEACVKEGMKAAGY